MTHISREDESGMADDIDISDGNRAYAERLLGLTGKYDRFTFNKHSIACYDAAKKLARDGHLNLAERIATNIEILQSSNVIDAYLELHTNKPSDFVYAVAPDVKSKRFIIGRDDTCEDGSDCDESGSVQDGALMHAEQVLSLTGHYTRNDTLSNYRELIKSNHPDLASNDADESIRMARAIEINGAYRSIIGYMNQHGCSDMLAQQLSGSASMKTTNDKDCDDVDMSSPLDGFDRIFEKEDSGRRDINDIRYIDCERSTDTYVCTFRNGKQYVIGKQAVIRLMTYMYCDANKTRIMSLRVLVMAIVSVAIYALLAQFIGVYAVVAVVLVIAREIYKSRTWRLRMISTIVLYPFLSARYAREVDTKRMH